MGHEERKKSSLLNFKHLKPSCNAIDLMKRRLCLRSWYMMSSTGAESHINIRKTCRHIGKAHNKPILHTFSVMTPKQQLNRVLLLNETWHNVFPVLTFLSYITFPPMHSCNLCIKGHRHSCITLALHPLWWTSFTVKVTQWLKSFVAVWPTHCSGQWYVFVVSHR